MVGTKRTRAGKAAAPVSSECVSVSDDGFIASDSDAPANKKTKTVASKASTSTSNSASNSEVFHDLSTGRQPRRVNVSEFKGKKLVNIREYYEKDGEMLPGKKVPNQPNLTDLTKQLGMLRDCLQGISLNAEQFAELLKALPDIKKALGYADVDGEKEGGDDDEKDTTTKENHYTTESGEPEVDGVKLTKKELAEIRLMRKRPRTFPIKYRGKVYFISKEIEEQFMEWEEGTGAFLEHYEGKVKEFDPEKDGNPDDYDATSDYDDDSGDEVDARRKALHEKRKAAKETKTTEEQKEVKPMKKEKIEPEVDGVKLTKKEIDIIKKTRKHPNYILMEKKGRGILPL